MDLSASPPREWPPFLKPTPSRKTSPTPAHHLTLEVASGVYIPKANQENRLPVLHALMRDHPLASLVTFGSSGLFATHLPMVLEAPEPTDGDGPAFGTLNGHISRANTQWRELDATTDAIAIFSGPQHYISATWYPGKYEDGKEVPTWNYAVVHAYGPLRVIEDPAWLLAHVTALTNIHEAASPVPWNVSDAPQDYIASQLRGIVGLELPIRRLEGKWKASQNRTERDRHAVLEGLESVRTPASEQMRDLVEFASPSRRTAESK
jgi:transcriptional regulator